MCLPKRWLFLAFASLTFFTTEIVEDQLSLQNGRLQGSVPACSNGDDSCLNFTSTEFNGLYATGFWAGGLAATYSGFFIARYGIWIASLTCAAMLLIGTAMNTVAPYLAIWGSGPAFGLMLAGRFLFASAYFSHQVVSLEVVSHWFWGKEMALAFTIYLSMSRLATVVSFGFIGKIIEVFALQKTLWMTFGIGVFGPICAIVAGYNFRKNASVGLTHVVTMDQTKPKEFTFSHIKKLSRDFWVLTAIIFFYYAVLFTFLVDGPKWLVDVYHNTESVAGAIIGAIPDISLMAPIFGFLIDKCGCRDIITCVSTAMFFAISLMILFLKMLPPLAICILIALSYALMTASIWSSIPVVTKSEVVGVAMGIATGTQALSTGLILLITGFILDHDLTDLQSNWMIFFIIMTVFAGISFCLSLLSIYLDTKSGSSSLRKRQRSVILSHSDLLRSINEHTPLLSDTKASPVKILPAATTTGVGLSF
ncbi:major facilitator superfamily domain-containing protein 1-like [Paramacrobiotus metropolitanus]|uniref:major facilitator superfamily domain-containing protein 1-like n=1 Tax=Paramacrobiotus metropolitanus TaxID=2943436 RepID=UPI0024462444|nr:major facilitator superfamily domain-containing protein 1-like [Paramacrobiotus metropolitanus]